LVFDEAEGLFGKRSTDQSTSTDRYSNMDVGLLLYHIERFPGIVILITNLVQNIDQAFFRRFKFIVEFKIPTAQQRITLWKSHLPPNAPKDKDIDFNELAEKYSFSGGNIKNACYKAAAFASLREGVMRRITFKDLLNTAEQELKANKGDIKAAYMFN